MEKLQAALQKARAERNATSQDQKAPQPKVGRIKPPSSRESDALWGALQELPLSEHVLAEHLIVTKDASKQATPFDIMRTKILLQMQENGWTRLGITSPMPQSGKTTMSCNLALGLGRQQGMKSMLFDFDLGDPSVSNCLDYQTAQPISAMLNGEVSFEEHARRIGQNIAVAASGQAEKDATRTLLSSKTHEALDAIQETYKPDIMIFDLPSVLVGDNTRSFLKHLDCALIVARAGNTKYAHFDKCEREVAEYTSVIGTVLNAFRVKEVDQYIE